MLTKILRRRGFLKALAAMEASCDTLPELIDAVFRLEAQRIRIAPIQVREELLGFLERIAALAPRRVLEIGTAKGGTLYLFTHVAATDALLVTVDLRDGEFGGGYPTWKMPMFRRFARHQQRVVPLQGDSHSELTQQKVTGALGPGPIDLLFLDGDHSYEGIRRDYEMYAPLVRAGGLIALHDIVPGAEASVGGVPRFWQEIKATCPHEELVQDWQQGGFGIGLLTKP